MKESAATILSFAIWLIAIFIVSLIVIRKDYKDCFSGSKLDRRKAKEYMRGWKAILAIAIMSFWGALTAIVLFVSTQFPF